MKNTRIALIQICPEVGELRSNTDKHLHYIRQAAEEGAELAVFPECSLTGYSTGKAGQAAVSEDGPFSCEIRSLAAGLNISVCFGYIRRENEDLFITQELYSGGKSVCYDKTHLGTKEKEVFRAGSGFPVLEAPVMTGMQLCWESHIPEISAAERKQGAELLLIPYASPMSGERCRDNWNVHLPARASDNGAYVAACNLLFRAGDDETSGDLKDSISCRSAEDCGGYGRLSGGGLAVYDPKGRPAAAFFAAEEHMILCDLCGPLPREIPDGDMRNISYFDRKRGELF